MRGSIRIRKKHCTSISSGAAKRAKGNRHKGWVLKLNCCARDRVSNLLQTKKHYYFHRLQTGYAQCSAQSNVKNWMYVFTHNTIDCSSQWTSLLLTDWSDRLMNSFATSEKDIWQTCNVPHVRVSEKNRKEKLIFKKWMHNELFKWDSLEKIRFPISRNAHLQHLR